MMQAARNFMFSFLLLQALLIDAVLSSELQKGGEQNLNSALPSDDCLHSLRSEQDSHHEGTEDLKAQSSASIASEQEQ